jgi:hypothetical protein
MSRSDRWFLFCLKMRLFQAILPIVAKFAPPLASRVQGILLPLQQKLHRFHDFESFGI